VRIFPLGAVQAANNQGLIGSISYNFFEPNQECKSQPTFNVLQTKYLDQTMVTRKKSAPFISILYNYNNIFTREYRQIERFIHDVGESLNTFHAVDLSRGLKPSAVASAANKWSVSVDDTYFYSATAGYKANRAFLWNGNGWKEGAITGLTLNASITVDIGSNNYGALPLANAGLGLVYPVYEVYGAQQALQNFTPGAYWEEDIKTNEAGGFMYTGNMNFTSKYKV